MNTVSIIGLVLVLVCVLIGEFGCEGVTVSENCSQSDIEALMDIKNGLNDPENRLSSWKGRNCCQWRGIGCDNLTEDVISIDLHNPYPVDSASTSRYGYWNLSGDINPSLLKLTSLQFLDLSLNTFDYIRIPEFLGSLKSLRYLNLSKAGFSGVVPPSLGNLSSLQVLDVSAEFSGLTVSNLNWITGLVSVKYLSMDGVDLSMVGSNWLMDLNMLPHLTELHLSMCSLSGSISLLNPVNFSSLSVIDLSFNAFNSMFPDWLVNITSLTHAELSNAGLYGRIPLGFSELPNLRYLSLSMNNNLSASCSQLFKGSWNNVEVLDFATNNLHGNLPASIGNMSSLTNLNLFFNNVGGRIPGSISKLCNLKNLDLSGNNLTGGLPEVLEPNNCSSNSPLPSLIYLRLGSNRLVGNLPEWLGQLELLVELDLQNNFFQGQIPPSLGNLKNLTDLGLGNNQLNGTLPESFGKLTQLSTLDVSFNHLTGLISEMHFDGLSRLKYMHLASNSFTVNVSSDWIPPFQVINFDMGSCHLGPPFPAWLQTQKAVNFLDFSNASISAAVPDWFWDISSNLSLLNMSFNQLQGQLPNPFSISPFADVDFSSNLLDGPIPLPVAGISSLDLSNNQFSGFIPENIAMLDLIFISLSGNMLTGHIPTTIGNLLLLQVIDLSNNSLMGNIPSSIGNCSFLKALDFSYNNLSGSIPESLGQLSQLQSLHLSDNNLTGNVPSSLWTLPSLETLDLGNNRISGNIPSWIGGGFQNLRILSLRSNAFSGAIPSSVSNLSSLQVLDLALNNLTGKIPATFGDFKSMSREEYRNEYLHYGKYRSMYYEENFIVNIKGGSQRYTKTLSLVTSMDLSDNNLIDNFPEEITKLIGLVDLNLSKNRITGHIPDSISNLEQLLSLDLSSNMLSGSIPSSMSKLTYLGLLNLSNNNLSGMIPQEGQMVTFPPSSFAGNLGLCGIQLEIQCQNDDNDGGATSSKNGEDNDDRLIHQWFYLSVGLGFAAGILVPMLVLAMKKSWSEAYFGIVERVVERSTWVISRTTTRTKK